MNVIQLWLVRHGQTEENIKKILCGQNGGHLTNLGVKQAQELGKRLSREVFEKVYVSDLDRTVKTYEAISQFSQHKPSVLFTPLIREKHAGVLDGKSLELPKQMAAQQKLSIREFRPDKGENWIDVNARAQQFLELVVLNHLNSSISEKDQHIEEQKQKIVQQQKGQFEEQKQQPFIQVQQQKIVQKPLAQQIQVQFQPQGRQKSSQQKQSKSTQPIKQLMKKVTVQKQQQQTGQNQQVLQFQLQGNKPEISVKNQKTQIQATSQKKVSESRKILIVTHGGFIMEFINMALWLKEKRPQVYQNNSSNCSITIFQIKKKPNYSSLEDLQIEILLQNDNTHCANLK